MSLVNENLIQEIQWAYEDLDAVVTEAYTSTVGKRMHPLMALAHVNGNIPLNQPTEYRSKRCRHWLYQHMSKNEIDGFVKGFAAKKYDPNTNNEFRKAFKLGRTLRSVLV